MNIIYFSKRISAKITWAEPLRNLLDRIASYYEIDANLVSDIGLAKRLGTETFSFIEDESRLQRDHLYYLIYRGQKEIHTLNEPRAQSDYSHPLIMQLKRRSIDQKCEKIIVCPYS